MKQDQINVGDLLKITSKHNLPFIEDLENVESNQRIFFVGNEPRLVTYEVYNGKNKYYKDDVIEVIESNG